MAQKQIAIHNIVGVSEIAESAGVTSQAVTNWAARYEDFPRPVISLDCGPIYNWVDMSAWLIKTGRMQ